MPNEVTVKVANLEVAAELDGLADKYEEVAQELRFQAEHFRKGFDISLKVTASQVAPPAPDQGEDIIADLLEEL